MKNKKKGGKKFMAAILITITLIALLFVVWIIISPGEIRKYEGEKSISEKFVMEINGAPNGFFINGIDIDNPVLLLVSSGPGTDDYVFTDKYKDMRLEEEYTVVYWDYRSMGIAYDKDYDTKQITLENLLNDTHEVTEYLKKRFEKEKIYIMGFSGGSHIALKAAQQYPEDYYAYIGMAQVVTDSDEQTKFMYDFMKKVFTSRDDKASLKKLEKYVELTDDNVKMTAGWPDFVYLLHKAGGGTIKDKTEFEGIVLPIIFCKCYTVDEKINYVKAMKMYRQTPLNEELTDYDYRNDITSLNIPAYFISGEYDYNCPWELVEDYEKKLDAPDKDFYLIPDSAHSPLWENSEKTCEILKQIKEKTENE